MLPNLFYFTGSVSSFYSSTSIKWSLAGASLGGVSSSGSRCDIYFPIEKSRSQGSKPTQISPCSVISSITIISSSLVPLFLTYCQKWRNSSRVSKPFSSSSIAAKNSSADNLDCKVFQWLTKCSSSTSSLSLRCSMLKTWFAFARDSFESSSLTNSATTIGDSF